MVVVGLNQVLVHVADPHMSQRPAAGGVELGKPEYSGGVRQELHRVAEQMQQGDIEIHQGRVEDYVGSMMTSR